MDYSDGDFTDEGYYLVTYGGEPKPDGPHSTLEDLIEATGIDDYPADGYIVSYDPERDELGSVPSLDPSLFPDGWFLFDADGNSLAGPMTRDEAGDALTAAHASRNLDYYVERDRDLAELVRG